MVQRAASGEEFSIDVFCDLDGRCLAAIPRTMIESKGGESIKGMTIKDPDLIEFAPPRRRGAADHRPANVQCFREPDGGLQVTDVNPRFGGGFPLPTRGRRRATPSSRSRSQTASSPSRASATSARAS